MVIWWPQMKSMIWCKINFLERLNSSPLSKSQEYNNQANRTDLIIFIATHKNFICSRTNPVYKILADDPDTTYGNYPVEVIYTDIDNDLYLKRIGYGEMSKFYWVYKHYRPLPKYVGLNHYRRYFNFLDNVPNMDEIFSKYDAIVIDKACFRTGPLYNQYKI